MVLIQSNNKTFTNDIWFFSFQKFDFFEVYILHISQFFLFIRIINDYLLFSPDY